MFRAVPLSIIRRFSLQLRPDPARKLSANLYDIYTIAPDDGQRNCPKHVEFYSKNKFEKLMHLVGFIIRMFIYEVKIRNCHLKCC